MRIHFLALKATFACALLLAGCGGGGDSGGTTPPPPAPTTYTIGGTVAGLAAGQSVVLQNNAANNTTVSANGNFSFSSAVNSGGAYAVTVLTQPTGQTCTVANGSGTASANVTNVAVTCANTAPTARTIGGTVSGLAAGQSVVLQNNGANNTTVSANGAFTFSTTVANGGAYAVTVLTQPAGQTCAVTSGSGTANANVTNVAVACTTAGAATFTVGGTVSGLAPGGSVTLQSAGAGSVAVNANGVFALPTALAAGSAYNVAVTTQPTVPGPGQNCVVTSGAGTVASANIANIVVTCSNTDTGAPTITASTPLPTAIGAKVTGGVVTVTFSEAMLPSSVTTSSLTLTGPAGPVSGTVTLVAGNTQAVFTPTARLAFDADYTASVTTAVKDASGNALGTASTWSFNTGKMLAVGDLHTCARMQDGRVKCWGDNQFGQLGYDSTTDQINPATVPAVNLGAGRTAVAISAADYDTCAILDDGSAKCWGLNTYGQLGQGNTTTLGDSAGEMAALQPINFGASRKVVEIFVGQEFSCARLDNATVKCWGRNERAQLGVGQGSGFTLGTSAGDIAAAAPVDLGTGLTPVQISLGHYHACVLLVDAVTNRSAKCWGDNNWGEVGLGNTDAIGNDPAEMGAGLPAVNFGTGRTPRYLMASGGHTCAQLDDLSVKCWGLNTWGQVGLNIANGSPVTDTQTERRTCNGGAGPVRPANCIGDEPGELGNAAAWTAPVAANGSFRLTSGYRHNCVLRPDKASVACWGSNEQAQLGNGTGGPASVGTSPAIVGDEAGEIATLASTALPTSRTFEEISGGGFQTCVVSANLQVTCWGDNTYGQLGRNATSAPIGDDPAEMGNNLVDVDLGT